MKMREPRQSPVCPTIRNIGLFVKLTASSQRTVLLVVAEAAAFVNLFRPSSNPMCWRSLRRAVQHQRTASLAGELAAAFAAALWSKEPRYGQRSFRALHSVRSVWLVVEKAAAYVVESVPTRAPSPLRPALAGAEWPRIWCGGLFGKSCLPANLPPLGGPWGNSCITSWSANTPFPALPRPAGRLRWTSSLARRRSRQRIGNAQFICTTGTSRFRPKACN